MRPAWSRIVPFLLLAVGRPVLADGDGGPPAWRLHDVVTAIAFDDAVLQAAGLELHAVEESASVVRRGDRFRSFTASDGESLALRVPDGVFRGVVAGTLRHRGGFSLRQGDGRQIDLHGFLLSSSDEPYLFTLRDAAGAPVFQIAEAHVTLDRAAGRASFLHADVRIAADLAGRLARPELSDLTVGELSLVAALEAPAGTVPTCEIDLVSPFDLQLTAIGSVSQRAREPGGRVALAGSASLFNYGPGTIEWYRAIAPDGTVGRHPYLVQALYRLDPDGRFREIGRSDVKHAFYAVNSGCVCPGGQLLFAGCGDNYGVSSNSDRYYLAPRDEVTAHTGAWSSLGSHFDVYPDAPADDVRSHFGDDEHDDFEHRLVVAEPDLGVAGARYFVELWYDADRDSAPWNNIARREAAVSWDGSIWTFSLDATTTLSGPAIDSWVDPEGTDAQALSTTYESSEGRLRLASRVRALDDGGYRYDYALFDLDFDRGISAFSVPVNEASAAEFRGAGSFPAVPWTATVRAGGVRWAAGRDAALTWGTMFGFSFVSAVPPGPSTATLRVHAAGSPRKLELAILAPATSLFADDFESGSTAAWSVAVPGG